MTITQDEIPEDLREIAASIFKSRSVGHKAVIKKIGFVIDGQPTGFVFDCCATIPGLEIKDGQVLYGGYTVSELEELCALDRPLAKELC